MARPTSFAKVEIETGSQSALMERAEPDMPFRIAILGDFCGRANRGLIDPKLEGRRPVLIDRDSFDEVMAQFAPELHLTMSGPDGPRIPLRFRELDDFHPDRIFERLKIFQFLRDTRERLNDRSTYEAAAAEVRSWSGQPRVESAPTASPPTGAPPLSSRGLLEEALSATETRGSAQPGRALDDFQNVLREIVAPYVEPKPDPQRPELIAQVDAVIGGQMRALLHQPDFQALEALWRGVFFLVRRLSTGVDLKILLLDVTKQELAADLVATYALLIEGSDPWAVLAGDYSFDAGGEDLAVLARMAAVARHAGAPFLAAASPRVLGCESLAATPEPRRWRSESGPEWDALRALPQASWLGLALPRFLLRLPYGKQTESTEAFAFEEFPAEPRHEHYLWGNPALACAYLLGEAFTQSGWDLRPGEVREISGLPAHVYRANGESHLKPCGETLLSEHAAEDILDRGLMPLLSVKGADAVRLMRFQSIAAPAAPLSGRWS